MDRLKPRRRAFILLGLLQFTFILVFALHVSYSDEADARKSFREKKSANGTNDTETFPGEEENFDSQYPMFQDIHVMVFIGFGFLMTFLKRYAFGALGFTFLTCAVVIQWGIFCHELAEEHAWTSHVTVDLNSLVNADILAAAVMISFGALLGKVTPSQLIFMSIIETFLLVVNEYIGVHLFEPIGAPLAKLLILHYFKINAFFFILAVDAGGSMFIHVFGAYFGLAASFILGHRIYPEDEVNKLEGSIYQSDINSMIGTLFLWLFWPSFNAGLLSGDQRHRAVIHTYLALSASCISTFLVSSACKRNYKYEMVHIQNATLAGGVCVGTSANMMIRPFGALIIGSFAGVLSTIGFAYIQGPILKKLHIHDTCGVNNLHGMPGIAAGLIGAVTAAFANEKDYGNNLQEVFPAMKKNRTALIQAGFQLAALAVTLSIAIVGGLITGCFLWKLCGNISNQDYHKDDFHWEIEEAEAQS